MQIEKVPARVTWLLMVGAVLLGSSSLAVAEEAAPTDAASAEAMAQHYAREAERFRALGGVGYKTGLVQRAEHESARYAALAAEMRTPTPPRSPDAQYWARVVEHSRRMGGIAYKTGLLQRAQAEREKYEPSRPGSVGAQTPIAEPWRWGKAIERFLMMGR